MKITEVVETLSKLKADINEISPVQIGFTCAKGKGFYIYKINEDLTIGERIAEDNSADELLISMKGVWEGLKLCIVE